MTEDGLRYIPETEFSEDLDRGLQALADGIAASGITIAAIARATRMRWETVSHAARKIPVRYDSARRIEYFLKSISNHEEGTQNYPYFKIIP